MALVIDIKDYRISKAIQEAAERIKNDMHCVISSDTNPLTTKELIKKSRDLQIPLYDLITSQKNR
jgi:hypothetical protein